MTLLATDVRTLVGSEVDVETAAGIVHGTLLSYTAQSLWLVAGEDDLMVPISSVRSVHLPSV